MAQRPKKAQRGALPLLRSVLDQIDDAVLVSDASGRVYFWNEAAERLLGDVSKAPLLERWAEYFGLCLSDGVTPCPAERFPLVRALQGEIAEAEFRMRSGRSHAWVRVSARPFLDSDGAVSGAVSFFRNVSGEKRQDQVLAKVHFDLQRSEEQFRSLIHNVPGAIYRCEPGGSRKVRFVSATVQDISGRAAADFIEGRFSFAALVHSDDDSYVRTEIERAVREKRAYRIEYRVTRADGSTRWISDKGQPVFGEGGEPLWLDGALFDITDHRQAVDELVSRSAELARSNAEREQLELFAYIASHDLKSPLQKIVGYAELLSVTAGPSLDGKSRDCVQRVQQAAYRMGQLIEDLLRFARAATHGQSFERVDLRATLDDVLSDFDMRLREKGARVEAGPLPVIQADPLQMRQLFQNLIGNALKFTRDGTAPVVRVQAREETDRVEILISDNGIGFDEKGAERMFRPFERLPGSEKVSGNGVGLAICKKIVERHGGRIGASSSPGGGSRFTIVLPRQEELRAAA